MAGWSCCVRGGGKLGGEGFVHSCNSFLLIIFWRNGWRCTSVGADGVPTLLPPGCLHGKRSVNLARPEKAGREVEQISVCGPMAYERVKMRVVSSYLSCIFPNCICSWGELSSDELCSKLHQAPPHLWPQRETPNKELIRIGSKTSLPGSGNQDQAASIW